MNSSRRPDWFRADETGSDLLTGLDLISIAPEAQWWLAPRFSVGKKTKNSQLAP
jgi:hypothetical protein